MNTPIKTPMIVVNAKPAMVPIPLLPLANPTYASGNIVFTDIKTYDAYLNDCSRVFAIVANGYPYKIVVLGEE